MRLNYRQDFTWTVFSGLSPIESCVRVGFPWWLRRCYPVLAGWQDSVSSETLALALENALCRSFVHCILLVVRGVPPPASTLTLKESLSNLEAWVSGIAEWLHPVHSPVPAETESDIERCSKFKSAHRLHPVDAFRSFCDN